MSMPKRWTFDDLKKDASVARRRFRKQRLDEPLALYSAFFDTFEPIFSEIVDRLPAMAEVVGSFPAQWSVACSARPISRRRRRKG